MSLAPFQPVNFRAPLLIKHFPGLRSLGGIGHTGAKAAIEIPHQEVYGNAEGRTMTIPLGHGIPILGLDIVARNACSDHPDPRPAELAALQAWEARRRDPKFCPESIVGIHHDPFDLFCKAFAQMTQLNIISIGSSQTVKDTTNNNRTVTVNAACTLPRVLGGTGSTAAAFADYTMQTFTDNSSYRQAATINAISSNTYTVTGTITNTSGSSIAYNEVGIDITNSTWLFLMCHDAPLSGGPYTVSNNGTLAVTYTMTWT